MKRTGFHFKMFFLLAALILTPALLSAQEGTSDQAVPGIDESASAFAVKVADIIDDDGQTLFTIQSLRYNQAPSDLGTLWQNSMITQLNKNFSQAGIQPENFSQITGIPSTREWSKKILITGQILTSAGQVTLTLQAIDLNRESVITSQTNQMDLTAQLQGLLPIAQASSSSYGLAPDGFEPDSPENPRSITLGTPVTGHSIAGSEDQDWFIISSPDSASNITIYTTSSIDTQIAVFTQDDINSPIASDDDSGQDSNAYLEFIAPPGTSYIIAVSGYSDASGSFTLNTSSEVIEMENDEPNDDLSTAIQLDLNETLETTFYPYNDIDYFKVSITPEQAEGTLNIQTLGSIDTTMELFSSNGTSLINDDDGGIDSNARVSISDITPGDYYVLVQPHPYESSPLGTYGILANIIVDPLEPNDNFEQATVIEYLDTEASTTHSLFSGPSDVDYFQITLSEATRIIMKTASSLDTKLELYNSDLTLLQEDDDSGEETNAQIVDHLEAGTYYIKVFLYSDELGENSEYDLILY